jgi:hypothetical protein
MCARVGCHDVVDNNGVNSTLVGRVRTIISEDW